MTILGTGLDIVNNKRVKNMLVKKKYSFKEKVFTKKEISYCDRKINRANYYSKKFAAKEAFVKALGTGFRKNIYFKDIEILNNKYGKPYFVLNKKINNKVKEIFKVNKFNIFLSISDEKNYSVANVIISKQ